MRISKKVATTSKVLGLSVAALTVYFFQFTILRKENSTIQNDTGTNWDNYIGIIKNGKEWLDNQHTEKVSITSSDGLNLCATFLPAMTKTKKTVIAFHGYKSKGSNDYAVISEFYHAQGYNVLIVDNRAHGESEGKYIGFGCLDRKDCLKWVEYAKNRFGDDSIIFLHGISMGAATVVMASGEELPSCVKGIISDCAFTSAWDIFKYILKRDYHMPPFPLLYTTSYLTKFLAGYGFRDCSSLDQVKKAKVPFLFIHGSDDNFVPTKMSKQLYDACPTDKNLIIVEGASHAESYYADTDTYEKEIGKFLNKYSS